MALVKCDIPPMGWNSWDCYGTTVTEAEVLANAAFMADQLLPWGWDTVVIDAGWADPCARAHGYSGGNSLVIDHWGRLLPDPQRFPSAASGEGFRPLAERIHGMGLRFGIHVMRGIPRVAVSRNTPIRGTTAHAADVADETNLCEWNPDMSGLDQQHPAARLYYDSLISLYASWGVDFIKADDMLWPYQTAEIEAFARAVQDCQRAIQLSLSPGRDLSVAHQPHLAAHATMWRICDDVWDQWQDVEANFARCARWAPLAGPTGWPDADMLPLGHIGLRAERGLPRDDNLTPTERITLLTLWAMARSPLMIGGDLPSTGDEVIGLFKNRALRELLASSSHNREVLHEDGMVVWTADGTAGVRWCAVFNLRDEPRTVVLDLSSLGLPVSAGGVLVDQWLAAPVPSEAVSEQSDQYRGVAPGSRAVRLDLDRHAVRLLRWSSSDDRSFTSTPQRRQSCQIEP